MDGHWDGSGDWGGLIFVPSVDELQEFKIQTNTFSPQYGWSMGNAVNVVTKSGTSSFHGGVFEFLRNGHLDANNFFNNRNAVARPMVHRNQFGFNLGGPLVIPKLYAKRDRTFIFGSYEGLRQTSPITSVLTVPTVEQREGDFSRSLNQNGSLAVIYNPFTSRQQGGGFVRDPFPDNRIPQQSIDPIARKLLAFFPLPNRPGDSRTAQQNFVGALGLPLTGDQYTIRVDHNVTQNQRLFTRWSQKRQFVQGTGAFFGADNPGGMGIGEYNPRWDTALGYTYTLNPATIMNVTLGWGRWVEQIQPQGVPFQPSSLGLPSVLDTFGGPGAFPVINVDGLPRGLGSGALTKRPRETGTYALDFTHIRGRHTLTAGFTGIDFRLNAFTTSAAGFNFTRSFTQGPDPTRVDPNSGVGVAALLLGSGASGGITLNANPAFSKHFYAWYFNDDFRLRRNLTLNLGLRYDFQTAPTDRFDRLTYWTLEKNSLSDATGLNLVGGLRHTGDGNPRGVYDPQYTNLAPRVGLTYSPWSRLVMRTGFGIFYSPALEFGFNPLGGSQGLSLNGFSQTTPYTGTVDGFTPVDLLRNPFPRGLLLPAGKTRGDRTDVGLSITALERDRPTPYVEQWTFGLQYQVEANTVIEAAYVGNHGVKLPFGVNFQRNQLRPELLSMGNALLQPVPNPFSGLITAGVLSTPTVTRGRLLRPYPEFDAVTAVQPPAGMSNYQAFNLSANRRFSRGLQFQVAFTASKYLTNTEGPEGGISQSPAQAMRNYYNISQEKSLMNNDVPRSLVISYIYELPVGKGKRFAPGNRWTNAAIGGWQIAGITTFKSGFPLAMSVVTNLSQSLGGNQRPNIVGDPHIDHPSPDRWFNTNAFAPPAAFTFGNGPRTMPNLRADGTNNFDISVQKHWKVWSEQSKLQFRSEFFNLFNRTPFYTPFTGVGDPALGQVFQALPARSIQFGLKLSW